MKKSKIAPAETNVLLLCLAIGLIAGSVLSLIFGKIEFVTAGVVLGLTVGIVMKKIKNKQ